MVDGVAVVLGMTVVGDSVVVDVLGITVVGDSVVVDVVVEVVVGGGGGKTFKGKYFIALL